MKKITHYEQMLMPFAARGNRNSHVVNALHELSKARKRGCWFYYVSDPLTFVNRHAPLEIIKDAPDESSKKGDSIFNIFTAARKTEPADRDCVMARSARPWEGLVFAGFVPLDNKDRMKNIREMRKQLAASKVFDKVDLMAEVTELEASARKPWMEFGMIPFRFGCRFANPEFEVDKYIKKAK